ncbi:DUF2846 domain-containing protein [Christiangramia sp. SM2212]|uniref:DUF2846 domain-containing protein n=1 Tax=Christiangramia sediminicola TaxID=3073267 RepID=A0ABU1EQP3_9FLAO|nr:DUF2846 domain-containing protein [Christiangramia sp. SM2212]MDR5590703.1 DUF2846 domain-containing protein [Christiangramia sp. SM2212]
MKKIQLLFIFLFFSISIYAQDKTAEVYIIRDTQSIGSLTKFEVFVDDEIICEIKNHKYIITNLTPGIHKFSVQMTGKKSKANVDHFELELEANEEYYLQVETPSSVMGSSHFTEVTKNSANKIIPKLEEQEDCD